MRSYKKITILGNLQRRKLLIEFGNLIATYFNNTEYLPLAEGRSENEEAKQVRGEINKMLDKIHSVIISAGVRPILSYIPSPEAGGWAGDVNLIHNIFHLDSFQIKPQELVDVIQRAIGVL